MEAAGGEKRLRFGPARLILDEHLASDVYTYRLQHSASGSYGEETARAPTVPARSTILGTRRRQLYRY